MEIEWSDYERLEQEWETANLPIIRTHFGDFLDGIISILPDEAKTNTTAPVQSV